MFSLHKENGSCCCGRVTNLKKPLSCFLFRVGNDDSGPEDIVDDEDLECEKPLRPNRALMAKSPPNN